MNAIKFVLWLLIAITYGLAPLWAVGFGFGSIIFVALQILSSATPIFWPYFFYTMFFLSFVASGLQYGGRREPTTPAPPPSQK